MKSKKLFILTVLIFLPLVMWGQEKGNGGYAVTGTVLDSLTMQGEPYATIRIYAAADTVNAADMLVSDENGKFTASVGSTGDYRMMVTSVGKKTVWKDFAVKTRTTKLGNILMTEDVEELGEISVVAKKPLVKVDMDKIAYDVAEDPDSQTKTVMDMMRKVPMITVDGEDNISVAGKSSYKIYVNGKPNNMMTNNPKEVLKSMPASSVKNIEVITNPGAKYDAEGVGGIINIVTEGAGVEGYMLNASASYSNNNGYYGSLYGTTQVGKFAVSGGLTYGKFNSNENRVSSSIEYFDNPALSKMNTSMWDMRPSTNYTNAFLDASYEIDTLNLISASGSFYDIKSDYDYNSAVTALRPDGSELYHYGTRNSNMSKFGGGNFSVDYQHTSPRNKQETFILSYRLERSPVRSSSYLNMFDVRNFDSYDQHLESRGTSFENTLQADYTLPVGTLHTLNFGAKYINRINDSDNSEMHRASADDPWEVFDRDGSGETRHRQHVAGAYAEYNLRYKSFGLKGGVRYEYTLQNVEFSRYSDRNFSARFSDFVPSLLMSYNIGYTQNLSLGYNMRISRPGIQFLNPFRDTSNSLAVVKYGNPDLETEHYHTLTLGYGTFSPNFSMNLNTEYSFSNDDIMDYSFVDNKNVINQTYGNIGRQHVAKLNMFISWNPTGSTRLMFNGNGGYVWLSCNDKSDKYGLRDRKNEGLGFHLYGNVQQNLPWKLNISAYGGYGMGEPQLETEEQMTYYFYGLQLQRSFLKNERLTVSLSASNFLPKYMKYKSSQVTSQYRSVSENMTRNLQYSITVSYRLGDLKTSVKKAAKSIVNSDVVGGASSGGGNAGASGGMGK